MIIPIDDDNQNVGADCLLCFDANQTPNRKTVSFSAMRRGDLWLPGHGPPPNESFIISQVGACDWTRLIPPFFSINNQIHVALSFLEFKVATHQEFFHIAGQCDRHYTNQIVNPAGQIFYGGFAVISWTYPFPPENVGTLASSWGIPTDGTNTFLQYAMANEQEVVKFQDPTKTNKISIKRDFS